MAGVAPQPDAVYPGGVVAVDACFERTGRAAVHLVLQAGRAALVDCGTVHSIPNVLAGLARAGVEASAVDWLVITHVHLDHAGGAGPLLHHLPNATVLVHPRGLRHMAAPGRLFAAAAAVYGAETVQAEYGDPTPIPLARLREAVDGEAVYLAGTRPLTPLFTDGHARHHLALADPVSGGVFAGDTFGISFRELDGRQHPHPAAGSSSVSSASGGGTSGGGSCCCIYPATAPADFDPPALHRSIDRVAAAATKCVYLTHYGRLGAVEQHAAQLHVMVDRFVGAAMAAAEVEPRGLALREVVRGIVVEGVRRAGCTLGVEAIHEVVGADVEINAQGLDVWLEKKKVARL